MFHVWIQEPKQACPCLRNLWFVIIISIGLVIFSPLPLSFPLPPSLSTLQVWEGPGKCWNCELVDEQSKQPVCPTVPEWSSPALATHHLQPSWSSCLQCPSLHQPPSLCRGPETQNTTPLRLHTTRNSRYSINFLCSNIHRHSKVPTFLHESCSSLHLPVTLAQLMRPGIGWNVSCTVGDSALRLDLPFFRDMCCESEGRPVAVVGCY